MIDFNLHGVDLFGDPIKPKNQGIVASRFTFPPFTILDAKQGDWQERKREWISLGIKSEEGRDIVPTSIGANAPEYMQGRGNNEGGSIFDPVVCELMYSWFSAKNSQIIDPFAGGSVRGIVAGALGRKYWGCDLRQEQVTANQKQKNELFPDSSIEWICGDSAIKMDDAPMGDFLFSCPPYGDLEVYSDGLDDLSNMSHEEFVVAYKSIIKKSISRLKNDRFAAFVVGDFRDKKGFYRNFVSETISAFEDAGARLYNEAILATSVGTACLRVSKQFLSGKKFAKTHQNILVFCKGDWKKATEYVST